MELNQRQQDILTQLNENRRVTVRELAQNLFYSEMTIRRDLSKLEAGGYLRRYHGGALPAQSEQYPLEQRMYIYRQEKGEIAKFAEKHLRDGQTILLLGCSTCAYLLPLLKRYKGLHVFTNSLLFLSTLSEMQIRCTVCGGELYVPDKLLIGQTAEAFFRSVNYDIAFLGCDGIAEDGTISVLLEHSVELVKIACQNARKRIVIADHSKSGIRSTYNICKAEEIDELIVL